MTALSTTVRESADKSPLGQKKTCVHARACIRVLCLWQAIKLISPDRTNARVRSLEAPMKGSPGDPYILTTFRNVLTESRGKKKSSYLGTDMLIQK